MAKLFKDRILREKLENYEIPDLEKKIAVIKGWYDASENGSLQQKTETQCEQAFNQDFFVEVLGYTPFPNETYTIDPKARTESGGQKPDAILGYFGPDAKRTIAVVEIKDANTALDKPQRREGNMSPIQQAFKYKPQYKECDFAIATNFVEIRVFKDNQLDYEKFTLGELVDPKDDYFAFKKFYYLLNVDNFVTKKGKTITSGLLSAIRIEQEEITKDFYQEYKELRYELIKDIVSHNKTASKRERFYPIAVTKAQKIVDRVVLIHFFEDLGLLPDNKLKEVVDYAEKGDLDTPVWDVMKHFFKAIDSGSEKLQIPDGYNGELFKEDIELDQLTISDDVCKKFVDLGRYDFSEDLTVNILGHIFEQSITDLERLKSYAEKGELDEKESKRKKEGIYYTPEYIVDYIVKNSLGAYLEENEKRILEDHGLKEDILDKTYDKRALPAYKKYQEFLRDVKVLDPACGSGAFLVKVFDYLFAENKRIVDIIAQLEGSVSLFSTDDYIKELLQNNIFGVDLNPESVEITKLSLWLKTARKGKRLVNLQENIKCGNSLIDNPEVAGERAFNWDQEFPKIIKSGGFDVVVGNPPYAYRNAISDEEKEFFKDNYESSHGNFDLYKFFMERLSILTKTSGRASFIVPNTFLTATTYKKLRELILNNFVIRELYDLGLDIFEGVVVESVIFIFEPKNKGKDYSTKVKIQRDREQDISMPTEEYEISLKDSAVESTNFDFNIYVSPEVKIIIDKLRANSVALEEICYCTVGINTGYIKSDLTSDKKVDDRYHKMLNGKDIGRHHINWAGEWIMYDPEFVKSFGNKGRTLPPQRIFDEDKILVQRTRRGLKRKLVCCFDSEKYYNLNRLSNIVLNNKEYDLLYIYSVVNSTLLDFFFNKNFNEYEVKPVHLNQLPIKIADKKTQDEFAKKSKDILNLTNDFYAQLQKDMTLLKEEIGIQKISKKLTKFYTLQFDEFVSEIEKKSADFSEKENILNFFNKKKEVLKNMKQQIDQLDQEIDRDIYALYGVEENEIIEIKKFYSV